MLFSVIIPVYNVELYLRQCIDSVINQGEKSLEIVLVDDGSTDSSGSICDEYYDQYPDTVRVIHKKNEGLLFTRRRGIRECRGNWLIHLDSDDYMLPGTLSELRKIIDGNKDLDLIIAKIAYGSADGHSVDFYSKLPFKDNQLFEGRNKEILYRQFLLGGYMTSVVQKVAHKSIVDSDTDYSRWNRVSLAEDALQSLPLLTNSKKAIYIDKAILYYRHNSASITKKKTISNYINSVWSLIDVYSEERQYYKTWSIDEDTIKKICATHCRSLCSHIKSMISGAEQEEQRHIEEFLMQVRNDDTWKWIFAMADRKQCGHFSVLCYKFIQFGLFPGLRMLCNHI